MIWIVRSIFAVVVLPVLFYGRTEAQGWITQSSGTSSHLQGVAFSDNINGVAVGGGGTIRRTINGGTTWVGQASGTSVTLYDAALTDANTGTVVGDGGTILRTTNGGITWTSQTSGTPNDLFTVSFFNSSTGLAAGENGTILRTTNGGSTWSTQTSGTSNNLLAIAFINATTASVAGQGGVILRSTNGGINWTAQSSGTAANLEGLSFYDGNTGVAVGDGGVIRKTTNGGTSWTSQTSGVSHNLQDVQLVTATKGYVTGTSGTILRTINGGTSWTLQSSGISQQLRGVAFSDPYTGTCVGNSGAIIRTTSSGISCVTITVNPSSLPGGTSGVFYTQSLSATGGTSPYLFALTSGTLPTGLNLSSSGVISGTPSGTGSYTFTITATDDNGCQGVRTYTLSIACATITILPSSLASGTVGQSYTQTLNGSGGTSPHSFSVTGGALPAGLSLSSGGILSGTPSTVGISNFTVTATDAQECSGTKSYSITISCPTITLSPTSLVNGTIGVSYSQTLSSSGGSPSYSYTVTAGSLPPGLSLSSTGVFSGFPTTVGNYNFTVASTDAQGCTGSRSYSITINCPTLTVNPALLPNGTGGVAYAETLQISGGTAPFTFGVAAGGLPPGLALSSSGIISGTSVTVDTFSFTITVTDAQGCTGTRSYTLEIVCPALGINPATLLNATTGQSYSQTLSGSGGISPYNFGVTAGILPAGLTLSSAGLLSGTPSASGSFNFTVTVTDAQGCTGNRSYTLTVQCAAIDVLPASLSSGTVGTSYNASFSGSGGISPYTFVLSSGSLPNGISLSSGGLLNGTPVASGLFTFTVTATDAVACQGSRVYSITIDCPVISLSSLNDGTVGTAYNQTITANGGTAPYTFTLASGTLPAGLLLSSSGVVSGTPTAAGSSSFSVTATDAHGCSGNASYTVVVLCPTVSLSALPNGTVGISYNNSIVGSGGTAPYAFSLFSGSLPAGLTLATNGTISGTPTAAGSSTFTVQATDAYGCTGTQSYTIVMLCPVITLSPGSLPNGTSTIPYSQQVMASGGTAPYSFSLSAGSLPPGLSLSSVGLISGTPTTDGSFNFSVTATDAYSCFGTQSYSIVIGTCPTITLTPTILPNASEGSPYSETVSASGGSGPYTFAVTSGSLPGGLVLSSSGLLSGSPTVSGTFVFMITATDNIGCLGSQSYTLIVCGNILLSSLTDGVVGNPYSISLTSSGGTAPYSYSVSSGTLPTGLTVSSTGLVAGTPTATGSFLFAIDALDANGCAGTQSYTISMTCPSITVNPAVLPSGSVGASYSQTLSATGGSAAYTFALVSGTLPAGLTLSAAGVLSGTPTAAGSSSFTVSASDQYGCSGTQAYTVSVDCPSITLSPTNIPVGTVGSVYSQSLLASGGTSPYAFALQSGTLPAGITLSSSGVLSGTPTNPVGSTFTVEATDAQGCTGIGSYTLTINCPSITLSPASLSAGTIGSSYNNTINASGGTSPYTFAVTSGTLPPGVTLLPTGVLSGTPLAAGTDNFTVTATDAQGCESSKAYSITINCPTISLNPVSFSNGIVGSVYSDGVIASGGTAPYSFAIVSGTPPAGLALSPTGIISGTPTTVGTSSFTVRATDASDCIGDRAYLIQIDCPAIVIKPFVLPAGTAGTPYSQTLMATGGTAPFTFSVSTGILPPGLSLAPTGELAGTPTSSGTYGFAISATDAQGCTGNRSYVVSISCPLVTISPTIVLPGVVGVSYSQTLSGVGGTAPYGFTLASGIVPDGLTLSASGVLSGTPATGGVYSFAVTTTDANGCSGDQAYVVVVSVVPLFIATPTTITFGNVLVGLAEPDSVTVTNPGTGPLIIYSAASTSGHFSITPSSGVIPPSSSQKFYVGFGPASTGVKSGTVIFSHNATGSPETIALAGTGVAPVFSFLTTLNFGAVSVGNHESDSVTIMNSGSTTLTISSVLSNHPDFTVSPGAAILNPGESQTFLVDFAPAIIGQKLGELSFTHDGGNSPTVVPTQGVGVVDVVVRKYGDSDGSATSAGDRSPKRWHLALYSDSVSISSLVAAADTTELHVSLSDAGIYIAMEADSTAAWTRINGNGTRYDTLIVDGTTAISDTFVNFKQNSIIVRKLEDLDGNMLTTSDRIAKEWYLAIRKDSVTGVPLTSSNSGLVGAANLGDGTYYITEVDSIPEWVQLGYVLNGIETADTSGAVVINLMSGQSATVDFINTLAVHLKKFRTLTPEGLAQKKAVAKKTSSMYFCAQFTNNTGQAMNGLRMVSTTNGLTSIIATIESHAPFPDGASIDGRTWIFSGAAIAPGQTISICGIANRGRALKINSWNWILNGVAQAAQPSFTPPNQLSLLPMPNYANIRDDVFAQNGFGISNGLVIGVPRPDAAKVYGWARIRKSRAMLRSLYDRPNSHTAAAHGLDQFINGKAIVKEQTSISPRKHNNALVAEQIAFKFNIVASALEKIPSGLGELIYDELPANQLCGLMLTQIAARVDSALTFWRTAGTSGWDYPLYEQVLKKINRAFDGAIDTISFRAKLALAGVRPLVDVPFLHANPSAIPMKIAPTAEAETILPTNYVLRQNYPNPFNPTTIIEFDLVEPSMVTLKVYNVLGQEVAILFDRELLDEGTNDVEFDGGNLPSGVYFYRLIVESDGGEDGERPMPVYAKVQKMMLVK